MILWQVNYDTHWHSAPSHGEVTTQWTSWPACTTGRSYWRLYPEAPLGPRCAVLHILRDHMRLSLSRQQLSSLRRQSEGSELITRGSGARLHLYGVLSSPDRIQSQVELQCLPPWHGENHLFGFGVLEYYKPQMTVVAIAENLTGFNRRSFSDGVVVPEMWLGWSDG